jgi:hypothetical protein
VRAVGGFDNAIQTPPDGTDSISALHAHRHVGNMLTICKHHDHF